MTRYTTPTKTSKVLIVEDQPVSRKILEAMLAKSYTVISAPSGRDAIRLAQENNPDLVLLDIEMPEMDGFETMEALRNRIIDEAVPVIFLTAREDSESREKGLEAGAVDYITKPYDRQELSIKVKNHLALYEARKEIERRNKSMAREMEMASQLQNSLLPNAFPPMEGVTFSVYYKPYSRAGGDFYDVIEFRDSGVGVVLVDVAGHGVASAMIGAMFKMCFQSFAKENRSPALLLSVINDEMVRVLPDSDFLTVFYCIIEPGSLNLSFCNAGHPRPFLYRVNDGSIEELEAGGPLVGAFQGMDFEDDTRSLRAGDKILIFTDGVTEAGPMDGIGELYGLDRLQRVFVENISLGPEETLDKIVKDLTDFHGGDNFEDDVSLILISVG
jgi:serine phosphatase RsbU (regulator of sigma subunit)